MTISCMKIIGLIWVHNGELTTGYYKCKIGIIFLILVNFWYTNFLMLCLEAHFSNFGGNNYAS